MEVLLAALVGACLAYLINEINQMQKDLKRLLIDVAVLNSLIHGKRKGDN